MISKIKLLKNKFNKLTKDAGLTRDQIDKILIKNDFLLKEFKFLKFEIITNRDNETFEFNCINIPSKLNRFLKYIGYVYVNSKYYSIEIYSERPTIEIRLFIKKNKALYYLDKYKIIIDAGLDNAIVDLNSRKEQAINDLALVEKDNIELQKLIKKFTLLQ